MKYYQELYGERSALLVINDSGTYKGWNPSNEAAAKETLASIEGTEIETESDAQDIIDGDRLPAVVPKGVGEKVKKKYSSLTS